MRVMLDTNILVSMIFFPSENTRAFACNISENHHIILCDYVIEELRLVTERKFPHKIRFLNQFFMELPFEMVYTPRNLKLDEFPKIRDRKDSPILATSILENVDVFVTGDKDFLVLDISNPEILTMVEFIQKYKIS